MTVETMTSEYQTVIAILVKIAFVSVSSSMPLARNVSQTGTPADRQTKG